MKKLLSNFGKLSLFALIVITLTLLSLTLTSCSQSDNYDLRNYKTKAIQTAEIRLTFLPFNNLQQLQKLKSYQ